MAPIGRLLVLALGTSQLVCWGISYYLICVFADPIVADTGWSAAQVHGGFSLALVVMGLVSGRVGRLVDRHGGAPVMSAGSLCCAAGCTLLATCHGLPQYYLAWLLMGLAMRLFLYDAAFASLARIGGSAARGPIARITLLGGLASTVFWPLGHWLAAALGWRGALGVYAALSLATLALHLPIPRSVAAPRAASPATAPAAAGRRHATTCAWLYAWIVSGAGLLNSAMSAHMIGLLAALGLGTAAAIEVAALRGVGQSAARLVEVLFGRHWNAAGLNLAAVSMLPLAFLAVVPAPVSIAAGLAFTMLYGAGNGLVTITRGSLPLLLFEAHVYGSLVGRLLAPGFLFAAAAPMAFAWLLQAGGPRAALYAALAVALSMALASLLLRHLVGASSGIARPAGTPKDRTNTAD